MVTNQNTVKEEEGLLSLGLPLRISDKSNGFRGLGERALHPGMLSADIHLWGAGTVLTRRGSLRDSYGTWRLLDA